MGYVFIMTDVKKADGSMSTRLQMKADAGHVVTEALVNACRKNRHLHDIIERVYARLSYGNALTLGKNINIS